MKRRKIRKLGKKWFVVTALIFSFVFLVSLQMISRYQGRKWNYSGLFTVLDYENYTISVYDNIQNSVHIFSLPENVFVTIPAGYGDYRIKDIPNRAKTTLNPNTFMRISFSLAFGIPIHSTYDDLELIDKMQLAFFKKFTSSAIKETDLSSEDIFTKRETFLGKESELFVNSEKSSQFLRAFTVNPNLLAKSIRTGIINTSTVGGVAQSFVAPYENMGLQVVNISNEKKNEAESCSYLFSSKNVDTKQNKSLVHQIEQFLPCPVNVTDKLDLRYDLLIYLSDAVLEQ
jgi:hypothetical protein